MGDAARILIVDDDGAICRQISNWLEEGGYEASTCEDGNAALAKVSEVRPDMVLLDLVMPGMTGLAICGALKENPETARLPVVMLTGVGSREDKIRCLDIGADDFLRKPIDREELLARIKSILRGKQLGDRLLHSYMELDRLGAFAEVFADQVLVDWRTEDVAVTMAQEFLQHDESSPIRPQLVWGGLAARGRMFGLLYYRLKGTWHRDITEFPPEELEGLLEPYRETEESFLSKAPLPPSLRKLLRVPQDLEAGNFLGVARGPNVILAAGYPQDIPPFEVPLLKALLRHWSVFERIRREARKTEEAFFATMEALALTSEFYDPHTAKHIRRVAAFAEEMARALGHEERYVRWLGKCSQMHDIGKITIPLEIVNKAGLLSEDEMATMRRHTTNGAHILGKAAHLEMARNIARCHHENYDGSGYPEGLRGEEIPIEARIVKIVDIYDALRIERSYKPAHDHETALKILREGDDRTSPGHVDPTLLQAFLDRHEDMDRLYTKITENDA